MLKHRSNARLFAALCALSLSACGPSPNTNVPAPSATPITSPSANTSPEPSGAPTATRSDLTVHLLADASLAGFATHQTSAFNLCLGRIARATTKVGVNGTFTDLVGSPDLRAAGVTVEIADGRTHFTISRELTL